MPPGDERTARPSLLDRLIDDDPQLSGDPPISLAESVRRYKRSVLRDVEWLLNTRRTITPVPEAREEVLSSAFVYGLPDVSSVSSDSSASRRQLLRQIEECIETFEPRLTDIRVSMQDDGRGVQRSVHFVIEGILRMEPNPERVVFDTVLDLASGKIQVGGTGNA